MVSIMNGCHKYSQSKFESKIESKLMISFCSKLQALFSSKIRIT